jgi:hypothetical protein
VLALLEEKCLKLEVLGFSVGSVEWRDVTGPNSATCPK